MLPHLGCGSLVRLWSLLAFLPGTAVGCPEVHASIDIFQSSDHEKLFCRVAKAFVAAIARCEETLSSEARAMLSCHEHYKGWGGGLRDRFERVLPVFLSPGWRQKLQVRSLFGSQKHLSCLYSTIMV